MDSDSSAGGTMLKFRGVLGAKTAPVTVNVVVIGNVLHAGSRPATFPADAYDVDIWPAVIVAVILLENSNPLHSLTTCRRTVTVMFAGAGITVSELFTTCTLYGPG